MGKKLFFSVFLFIFFIYSLFSVTTDLDRIIDLNLSLKEISNSTPDQLDVIIASEKYVIIKGTVSSITEIERSEDNFILDIHIIDGEWIGLENVEVYKCIVNISGLEWENRFPKRVPREINEEHILLNNSVIVIGKVSDYVLEKGFLLTVINGQYIRKIQ